MMISFETHAQESVVPKCLNFNTFFMYLLAVFIIQQSGVTTYAYVDCMLIRLCMSSAVQSGWNLCAVSQYVFSRLARTRVWTTFAVILG